MKGRPSKKKYSKIIIIDHGKIEIYDCTSIKKTKKSIEQMKKESSNKLIQNKDSDKDDNQDTLTESNDKQQNTNETNFFGNFVDSEFSLGNNINDEFGQEPFLDDDYFDLENCNANDENYFLF